MATATAELAPAPARKAKPDTALAPAAPAPATAASTTPAPTAKPSTPEAILRIKLDGLYHESFPGEPGDVLRKRLARDGYLFVRGLAPKQRLLSIRNDILNLCAEHGWLDPTAPVTQGIYVKRAEFPEYQDEYMPLYRKLIQQGPFNACSQDPKIIRFFAKVLGGPILAHPRNIARISFPRHYENTTQPHQDFFYIHGTPETYTTWIPLGDCPRELGGLAIQEGSHQAGPLTHERTIGAGGNGTRGEGRWLGADYRIGDVVIFHSYTIHGALDNHTGNQLRLSLDYRYQRDHLPVDPGSLRPHGG